MNFNQPSLVILLSAAISIYIAVAAWKRRKDKAIYTLAILLIFSALWSIGYALELMGTTAQQLKVFGWIAYVGITTTPILFLIFALRYTQNDWFINDRRMTFLFSVPVFSLLMLATNDLHHLFYTSVELQKNAGYYFFTFVYGPIWYFHAAWAYLAGLLGVLLFLRMLVKAEKENRIKISFFIVGSLAPYFANTLYLAGIRPFGFLDLSPVGFIAMGALLMLGVVRMKLFEIKPFALDLLFVNIPDPIFVVDGNRQIANKNPAAKTLVELICKEKPRLCDKKLSENEDVVHFLLSDDMMLDFEIDDKIYQRDQSDIKLPDGKIVGTLIIFRDVTAAKMAAKTIEENEARFRSILENMPILLDAFDEHGNIIVWNKACEEATGYTADEIIGNPKAMELLYPNPEYREAVMQASYNENLTSKSFHLVAKNGQLRTIEWFDVFLTLQVSGWSSWGLGLDVTEQTQMQKTLVENEQKLRELNLSKDKFFSIMAHDLRSPFNSIIGLSELLLEFAQQNDYESVKKYAPMVLKTAKNTHDLLENLLEWSRTQIGQIEFKPVIFEMLPFVIEEVKLLQGEADNKSIHINVMVKSPFTVFADKQMLGSIFRNLLSNAIKFSLIGGRIEIDMVQENAQMIVSIQDEGVGMDADQLEKLFKLEESFTTRGTGGEKGSGLGLLICKEFTEKHQGNLWVKSQINHGSTFYFSLPMHTSDALLVNEHHVLKP